MEEHAPHVSVVIIGINEEKRLGDCIASVKHADYPAHLVEIIYADSGSSDGSVRIAKSFEGVKVIELHDERPCAARGRNAGMAAASHGIVQLLDSDTVLHPDWFKVALPHLRGNVGAVIGKLSERYPEKNVYHAIANLEWNVSTGAAGNTPFEGPSPVFGGNVLMGKDAFLQAGGYDPDLIAGEDPDLSFRMRKKGWSILRVNADMATHDIGMSSFPQYLRRAYRSGRVMAQIGLKYSGEPERFYLGKLARVVLGALAPPAAVILGLACGKPSAGIAGACAVAFRSFRKIRSFVTPRSGLPTAALYCAHLSFAVYPQILGVFGFLFGKAAGRTPGNSGPQRQSPRPA